MVYLNSQGGVGVKRDYSKALLYYTFAAHQGHFVALFNLAHMHFKGLGTNPNCPMAAQLYKKVAEKGTGSKMFEEAYGLFHEGKEEAALLRYEKLAEQGFEVAQSNVAFIYEKNLASFLQNTSDFSRYQVALQYYFNSAEQNNPFSRIKIGDYYFYGKGTEINYEKAFKNYKEASDSKIAQATFNIAYMHQVFYRC